MDNTNTNNNINETKALVVTTQKEQAAEVAKKEFSVYDSKDVFIRKYTTEIHGEGAGALAKMFAKKINGSIK